MRVSEICSSFLVIQSDTVRGRPTRTGMPLLGHKERHAGAPVPCRRDLQVRARTSESVPFAVVPNPQVCPKVGWLTMGGVGACLRGKGR